jgi:hypothetical protein
MDLTQIPKLGNRPRPYSRSARPSIWASAPRRPRDLGDGTLARQTAEDFGQMIRSRPGQKLGVSTFRRFLTSDRVNI